MNGSVSEILWPPTEIHLVLTGVMNVANLDLNLLVSLDALLRERSVTRAAARMGLGQPALSMALRRLRKHFGDELLTRVGNSYELTPLALRLREPAAEVLAGFERVFTATPAFDQATTRRRFHVLCSDHTMATLGPLASTILAERAPGAGVRFSQPGNLPPHGGEPDAWAEGILRRYDAVIAPHGVFPGRPHLELWSDTWVALVWSGNTRIGPVLTRENLAEFPWVLFDNEALLPPPPPKHELDPRTQVLVDSFLALPFYVVGTDRLALLPAGLAAHWGRDDQLRIVPLPGAPRPINHALWWHPTQTEDPEHSWFRAVFAEAGQRLGPASSLRPTA